MALPQHTELEKLLRHVVTGLDLTPTEREMVESRYAYITEWLEDPSGSLTVYSPRI